MFVSLGCDKNLVDTEMMLGQLSEKGYTFTDDETEADVVVVNTCCFIGDAKEESINTLLEMEKLKEEGVIKVLIASGCLAQRYKEEIQKEIPGVDASAPWRLTKLQKAWTKPWQAGPKIILRISAPRRFTEKSVS